MPLYEYVCDNGHRFTARRSVEDREYALCPHNCILFGKKKFSRPHNAPIPGIYNRVNRHWNEGNPNLPLEVTHGYALEDEDG